MKDGCWTLPTLKDGTKIALQIRPIAIEQPSMGENEFTCHTVVRSTAVTVQTTTCMLSSAESGLFEIDLFAGKAKDENQAPKEKLLPSRELPFHKEFYEVSTPESAPKRGIAVWSFFLKL